MKKIFIFITLLILQSQSLFSQGFTVADKPNVYVYIFTHYYNPQNVFIKDTVKSRDSVTTSLQLTMINPQVASSMVSSALAKWDFQVIVESMQKRISSRGYNGDNVSELLKSKSAKEADYIIVGEFGHTPSSLDLDIKVYDVKLQNFIYRSNVKPEKEISNYRKSIEESIEGFVDKVKPAHAGYVSFLADSLCAEDINPNMVFYKPAELLVDNKLMPTSDKLFLETPVYMIDSLGMSILYKKKDASVALLNDYKEILQDSVKRPKKYLIFSVKPFWQGKYDIRFYTISNREINAQVSVKAGRITIAHLPGCTHSMDTAKVEPIVKFSSGNIKIENMINGYTAFLSGLSKSPAKESRGFSGSPNGISKPTVKDKNYAGNIDTIQFFYCYNDSGKIKYSVSPTNDIKDMPFSTDSTRITVQQNSIMIENINLGQYLFSGSMKGQESFPGKLNVTYYQYTKIVNLTENARAATISMIQKSRDSAAAKQMVVYLDPFPDENAGQYSLFINDEASPFIVAKNVGEVHIFYNQEISKIRGINAKGEKSTSMDLTTVKSKQYGELKFK